MRRPLSASPIARALGVLRENAKIGSTMIIPTTLYDEPFDNATEFLYATLTIFDSQRNGCGDKESHGLGDFR
jgi:hypothetical protein